MLSQYPGYILTALVLYLAVVAYVTVKSYRQVNSINDYYLANRTLSPVTVGLSAGASGMSAWLLLGLPGETFINGMSTMWIVIGLSIGILCNWLIVAKPLRERSAKLQNIFTIPQFLAQVEKIQQHKAKKQQTHTTTHPTTDNLSKAITIVGGTFLIIFLTLYIATGFVAGAKLLNYAFGTGHLLGVIVTFLLVVTYSAVGGFTAISKTDVIQAILMIICLLAIPSVFFYNDLQLDFSNFGQQSYLDPFISQLNTELGMIAIVSALSWGLGYFGQNHILVRFMAIKNKNRMAISTAIGWSWATIGMACALLIGVLGHGYLFTEQIADAEKIIFVLTEAIFAPWFLAIVFVGVLAAIMSTADSQLLVVTGAITRDIVELPENKLMKNSKLVLVVVATIALILATDPDATIFGLVSYAWAGMGATFGPSVLYSVLKKTQISKMAMLVSMVTGAITVFCWEWIPITVLSDIYALLPGFVFASIALLAIDKLSNESRVEFEN